MEIEKKINYDSTKEFDSRVDTTNYDTHNENQKLNASDLTEAVFSRKKAESDAKTLINRLNMLKKQSLKVIIKYASKKIDETKNKAKEIMAIKLRNYKMKIDKEEVGLS